MAQKLLLKYQELLAKLINFVGVTISKE